MTSNTSEIKKVEMRFECKKCGKCCIDQNTIVNVTFADIDRMQRILKLDLNGLLKILGFYYYNEEPTEDQRKKMVIPPVQTEKGFAFVGLKKNENGRCVHLGQDNLCSIYDARPNICRTFPFHFYTIPIKGDKPKLDIHMTYAEKAKEYCPGIGVGAPLINVENWFSVGADTVKNILTEHVIIKKYHDAVKAKKIEPSAENYLLTVIELNSLVNAPAKKKHVELKPQGQEKKNKVSYQVRLKEKLKKMESDKPQQIKEEDKN